VRERVGAIDGSTGYDTGAEGLMLVLGLVLACAGKTESGGPTVTPPPTYPTDTGTAPEDSEPAPLTCLAVEVRDDLPLSPIVRWEQAVAGESWVEFEIDGGATLRTPARARGAGAASQVLLGIEADKVVTWRVVLTGEAPVEGPAVSTLRLPGGLPAPTLLALDAARVDPRSYLITSYLAWTAAYSIVLDRDGRIVWVRETPTPLWTLWVLPSRDGTHLLVDAADWSGVTSNVTRVALDGSELQTYATPFLHHPFVELPDETIAWGAARGTYETLEHVDNAGATRQLWSCEDWQVDEAGVDPIRCVSNSLHHDDATGTYYFSFYSLDSVAHIDPAGPSTPRWFGQIEGAYAFDPPESVFDWQHGVHLTDSGTLLVSTRSAPDVREETHGREYVIDDAARTLRLTWSYGEGEGIYASEIGDVRRLPGGNMLINYGSTPRIREVTADGELLWDVVFEGADEGTVWLGRQHLVDDLYALDGWDARAGGR
jgi:hypothetical protein